PAPTSVTAWCTWGRPGWRPWSGRCARPPPRDTGISLAVESLTGLAQARRLAAIALRTGVGVGPRISRLDRHLPEALMAALPELAGHLRDAVLGAVLALEPAERGVLLQTVRVWLDCGG